MGRSNLIFLINDKVPFIFNKMKKQIGVKHPSDAPLFQDRTPFVSCIPFLIKLFPNINTNMLSALNKKCVVIRESIFLQAH